MSKLDREWMQEWHDKVLRAAGGRCEKCHRQAAHVHHVISRRVHSLRFDTRNGCALCLRCHQLCHDHSPREFMEWFAGHRPADAEYLARMKRCIKVEKYSEKNVDADSGW